MVWRSPYAVTRSLYAVTRAHPELLITLCSDQGSPWVADHSTLWPGLTLSCWSLYAVTRTHNELLITLCSDQGSPWVADPSMQWPGLTLSCWSLYAVTRTHNELLITLCSDQDSQWVADPSTQWPGLTLRLDGVCCSEYGLLKLEVLGLIPNNYHFLLIHSLNIKHAPTFPAEASVLIIELRKIEMN